jgi:molybdate transport system substrate-binding protein
MKLLRRSRILCGFLWAALLWGPLLARSSGQPAPQQEITVSAAVSLKDALDDIAQLYRGEKPDVALHFNLGGSGTLQRQIEQGAPADVFISASPDEMDGLEAKGLLLAGTRKNLVTNRVVLIVPVGATPIASFQDLARPDVKLIAIGEPRTVPAGKYARQALTNMGLYDRLKPKFVLAKDVRQVLTYVETENVDAGIVYATDARISQKVKVVATAAADSHSPVIYPVAVIKASHDPMSAKEFEAFLAGPRGQGVFQKFGFLPAER